MAIPTAPVQTLLGAVRRALWRAQFAAAARRALWGSAALMLAGTLVHLAAPAVPAGVLAAAIVTLWAALLAQAAWRRPADAACALWADRHLGGASAFTTWLEVAPGRPDAATPAAVQWLERWAQARVPDGLRQLARNPPAVPMARALLSTLVCAALATVVHLLPDPGLPPPTPAAAVETAEPARPLADARPEDAPLVRALASALRPAQDTDTPEHGRSGRSPAPAPKAGAETAGSRPADTGAPPPPGAHATASGPPSGTTADAAPAAAGTTPSMGTGSGRDAGDSPDQRADAGRTKPLPGALSVQRSAAGVQRLPLERQADMDLAASYDEDAASPGASESQTIAALPASRPPTGVPALQLSPTESNYVQAWLKASGRNR